MHSSILGMPTAISSLVVVFCRVFIIISSLVVVSLLEWFPVCHKHDQPAIQVLHKSIFNVLSWVSGRLQTVLIHTLKIHYVE